VRVRTAVAVVGLLALLGGLVAVGLFTPASGGELDTIWVSDTPRETQSNHHAVGVAGDVIVAPVAEAPGVEAGMSNTSCSLVRLAPADGTVSWRDGVPAADCFTHALTEPAIGDVDGDGDAEAVVATTENALIAHDADTGREEWRVPLRTYGYGRPTVADVTPAPGPAVIVSDITGGVVVAHGNGTVAWRVQLNGTVWQRLSVWSAPVVTDADADGDPEILLGTSRGPVALSATGEVVWSRDGSATYATAAQVDDDPAVELFTGGSDGLAAYDGRNGSTEWSRSLPNARVRTAADGDGDGQVELYVGVPGGDVIAVDAATGETEWSTTLAGESDPIVPAPVVGDVDGDDRPEVVAALGSGTVTVLDPTSGAELAASERSVPIWTMPSLADLDDDGDVEVLVRYGDGRVVALDYTN
jgi:outer membrane protein assembly factor BamB